MIDTTDIPELLKELEQFCAVVPDPLRIVGSYILGFSFDGVIVIVRIVFNDRSSGADIAIGNVTTPIEYYRRGLASSAVQTLISWTLTHGLWDIRAVQIERDNETNANFWLKNGFTPVHNKTNDFKYVGTRVLTN